MIDNDDARINFIDRLSRSNIQFTEWEATFIDSINEREEPLTDEIDQLHKRYAAV